MPGDFDLERFVTAQDPVFPQVLRELTSGQKRTHWMWFVFPQLQGLGRSPTAERYAIRSREEATAFMAHPVLGSRLRECTELTLLHHGPIGRIFGSPDDLKFHSSMTLFRLAAPDEKLFDDALEKFFGGKLDPNTVDIWHWMETH